MTVAYTYHIFLDLLYWQLTVYNSEKDFVMIKIRGG